LKRTTRNLWLAALWVIASGCATYRPVDIPAVTSRSTSREIDASIFEGDMVRIVLLSGKQVSGRVLWVSGDDLGLSRGGNYGYEEVVVSLADIESVKIRTQSDAQIERGWFAAIGVALAFSVYYSLRAMATSD
jgi:hypothetical protein